jgi:hypothetical protein
MMREASDEVLDVFPASFLDRSITNKWIPCTVSKNYPENFFQSLK